MFRMPFLCHGDCAQFELVGEPVVLTKSHRDDYIDVQCHEKDLRRIINILLKFAESYPNSLSCHVRKTQQFNLFAKDRARNYLKTYRRAKEISRLVFLRKRMPIEISRKIMKYAYGPDPHILISNDVQILMDSRRIVLSSIFCAVDGKHGDELTTQDKAKRIYNNTFMDFTIEVLILRTVNPILIINPRWLYMGTIALIVELCVICIIIWKIWRAYRDNLY
jgi:hypothetical protein